MSSEQNGVIVKDRELSAMNRISKLLNDLSEAERERVMAWLRSKYASAALEDDRR